MMALASVTYAIIDTPRAGWTSPSTLGQLVLALLAIGTLLVYEPRRIDPVLELRFFRSVPFSGATAIAICAFGAFSGFLFLTRSTCKRHEGCPPCKPGCARCR
jgi:hypothetical protein